MRFLKDHCEIRFKMLVQESLKSLGRGYVDVFGKGFKHVDLNSAFSQSTHADFRDRKQPP